MEMEKPIHFGAIMKERWAEMHTGPFPPVGPDDVVIRGAVINLCTADYQQWMGKRKNQGFPVSAGHEFSGTICYMGENVQPPLALGMQVGAMYAFCGKCANCRSGRTGDCTQHKRIREKGPDGFYGAKRFADYIVCDQRFVIPVDESVPPQEAAFLEPVATVVHCAKRAHIRPMEDVVVIGAGTMGLLNAQVAHCYGARVIVTELDEKKLQRAREMGIADVVDAKAQDPVQAVMALTGGKGADCVIPAVGLSAAYQQGYAMLKQLRGRLVIYPSGYPAPELPLDPNELHYRKLEIIGSFGSDQADWMDAAQMIGKGFIKCSYSLEGVMFALRDIQKAYELAATPGTYRVSIDLQGV